MKVALPQIAELVKILEQMTIKIGGLVVMPAEMAADATYIVTRTGIEPISVQPTEATNEMTIVRVRIAMPKIDPMSIGRLSIGVKVLPIDLLNTAMM